MDFTSSVCYFLNLLMVKDSFTISSITCSIGIDTLLLSCCKFRRTFVRYYDGHTYIDHDN